MGRYLPALKAYVKDAVWTEKDSNDNMVIINEDNKYLIINQDEKIHHSNEVQAT